MLRQSNYHTVVYESHVYRDEDVLLSGSDDDGLDADQHRSKKRKIESLANDYLSGKPLFISSAALRGPFEKSSCETKDRYSNYIVGSPILPQRVTPVAFSASTRAPEEEASRTRLGKGEEPNPDEVRDRLFYQPPYPPAVKLHPASHLHAASEQPDRRDEQGNSQHLPPPVHVSSFFEDRNGTPSQTPEPSSDNEALPAHSSAPTPSRPPQPSPAPPRDRDHVVNHLPHVEVLGLNSDPHSTDRRFNVQLSPLKPHHNNAASSAASRAWDVSEPAAFTPINGPPDKSQRQLLDKSSQQHEYGQVGSSVQHVVPAKVVSVTKGKLPQVRVSRKKRKEYLEAVATAHASPLLFRRKNDPGSNPADADANKGATASMIEIETDKTKPRRVLFNSPVNVPSQRSAQSQKSSHSSLIHAQTSPSAVSPKPSIKNIAPAIDMSFDQGSLAVDFDFIDRHTNSILPACENALLRKSVSQQLRRAMRESGASFLTTPLGNENSKQVLQSATSTPTHVPSPSTPKHSLVKDPLENGESPAEPGKEGVVEEVVEEEFPFISTQAAMDEAHRGMFNTPSPEKSRLPAGLLNRTTPRLHQAQSPTHDTTITPFHEFNAKMAADSAANEPTPPANTQALFDNISPFISPEEPKQAMKKQKTKKRASFAPVVEEHDAMSSLLLPEKFNSSVEAPDKPDISASLASVKVRDQHLDVGSIERPEGMSSVDAGGAYGRPVPKDPVETSLQIASGISGSRSSSPDTSEIIFSQRGAPFASQRDQSALLQDQSVRFSDLLKELQSSRGSAINVDTLLASESEAKTARDEAQDLKGYTRRVSGKGRPSGRSARLSARAQLRESLSQPGHTLGRSPRPRISLSQADLQLTSSYASASFKAPRLPEPQLSGSTTIADDTTISMIQQAGGAEELQSSSIFGTSFLDRQPFPPGSAHISAVSASPRSKRLNSDAAISSYEAAQRRDGFDLDDTIDSITHSVLSPWDVETAMRTQVDASAA